MESQNPLNGQEPRIEQRQADPAATDLSLDDFQTLEELQDALVDVLVADVALTVDLSSSQRPPPVSLPEAVRVLRDAVQSAGAAPLTLLVPDARTATFVRNAWGSGVQRLVGQCTVGSYEVRVEVGDIVAASVDAIVNASNTRLKLGAGVSGAIRRACPKPDALVAAMKALAPISEGDAVITPSFGLLAPHIIHAASASGREDYVESAWAAVLRVADAHGFESIAAPALGCGSGGLSHERGAALLAAALDRPRAGRPVCTLTLICFHGDAADVFWTCLQNASAH